jgi:DNA-directed RNA polymerase sigma subunit (sigma70/sigma32)
VAAWTELSSIDRLTEAEQAAVADAMPCLDRQIRQRRFSGFVAALGYERCYDAGTSAYMRAAKLWESDRGVPFTAYAVLWVRKFLIHALAEATASGDVRLNREVVSALPMPDQLAEWGELIKGAFRVLPLRQREVLMLRSAGLTWPEVAEAMSCSMTLVRRYHVRAMQRLWKLAPHVVRS